MFPELVKKYFRIITLVFVGLLAALSAMLVNTRVEAKLGAVPMVDLSAMDLSADRGFVSVDAYEQILKKNVFNSDYVYKPETAKGIMRRSHDDYVLIGTVAWNPANAMAIIQAKSAGKVDVFRVGEMAFDDAEIKIIERRRVTIQRGNKIEILEMPDDRLELASLGFDSNVTVGEDGIAKAGENRFIIDKSVIESAFKNWGQMMRGARVMPNLDKGRINGFKISRIKSNSLYKKIGLENGDILHRINGIEFKGPEDAFRMMSELKNAKNVTLDITRKNRRETLSYSIR